MPTVVGLMKLILLFLTGDLRCHGIKKYFRILESA
jgi:hypothetical protein